MENNKTNSEKENIRRSNGKGIEEQPESVKYMGYTSKEMQFYSSEKKKILVIKLGAMGDVLRTTPILLGLKKRYPDSMIYWLTKEESLALLEDNPLIDKLLVYNTETILRLMYEKFNLLFNFEIDAPATLLANLAKSDQKFGYFFNEKGFTSCYNKGAENYLKIAYNDKLKKQNQKSYQEMMYETAELKFEDQSYMLYPSSESEKYAQDFKKKNNFNDSDIIIGVNMAAGKRWQSKLWAKEKIVEFVNLLSNHKNIKILLLGGRSEKGFIETLLSELSSCPNLYSNNPDNSLHEFIGIVNLCNAIITTDSLALHISLALKKPTIALFFCTPANEIKQEDNLIKISSPLTDKYFYTNEYTEELANSVSAIDVLNELKKVVPLN